jgi:phosphoribosylanthranilate isomerase
VSALLGKEKPCPGGKNMTHIKICGITNLKDAYTAIEAGADYLGFNFYPKSVRFIEAEECVKITRTLKDMYPNIKLVGVFVNAPIEQILTTLDTCSLDYAQLHGDETFEL